ncbi:MAG: glutamate mutase L [Bacillota bacterium]
MVDERRIGSILATDVGSTTTKVVLIEPKDGEYRLAARGEAPTTVEAPHEDVMVGVLEAIRQVEAETGRVFLDGGQLVTPQQDSRGVDVFVSTSSAGGGLQMTVAGLVKAMTGESAQRAALGAGAIVMDVISVDDSRLVVERIRRLKELRPDMILLSGGTDEGNISGVVALAEYIAAAGPRPRLGGDFRVPVIYAGNQKARDYVQDTLEGICDVHFVENIRPSLDRENLEPARAEIHRLFLEHVMAKAPGYATLLGWTAHRIQPTPMAVGKMMRLASDRYGVNILGVDIGGATTDIFSVVNGVFNRTVSANIGMSYSLANVLVEAGPANIARWVPGATSERDLRNWAANKMIRPTTLPEDQEELLLEHATAREALRLSLGQHHQLAVTLKGVQQKRTLDDALEQKMTGQPLVKTGGVDVIIGSGGVISNAPRRSQAALLLIDALEPGGICRLYVDSIFMMPHLGVLSEVDPAIALEVFEKDCLVPLGTCVAPIGRARPGEVLATVTLAMPGGSSQKEEIRGGTLRVIPLATGQQAKVIIDPARGIDLGRGPGRRVEGEVGGGVVGLILDGRGRPLPLPTDSQRRSQALVEWSKALDAYPADHADRDEGAEGRAR